MRRMVLTLVLAGLLGPVPASALNRVWSCTSGTWQTSGCWLPSGLPTAADIVALGVVGGVNTTLTINGATGSALANELYVDNANNSARSVTLGQLGGSLGSVNEYIGHSGTGTFNQSGGSNSLTGMLFIGNQPGGSGIYNLSGTGVLSALTVHVGAAGTGVFAQTGGTLTANGLVVGNAPASSGTYNLYGGSLSVQTGAIGFNGTGVFTQTGGTHTITGDLNVGVGPASSGTYNLSGTGYLSAANEYISYDAAGVFNQTGGTHTVTNTLYLGYGNLSNGSYDLSGTGSLSTANEYIGYYGTGVFTQNGGTHSVSQNLYLGTGAAGDSTYTLNGGALTVNGNIVNDIGISTFNINGGTLSVAGGIDVDTFNLGSAPGTFGSHTVNGAGILSASMLQVGSQGDGALTIQNGGSVTTTDSGLGIDSGSNGTVLVTDAGSTWTSSQELYIGYFGTGMLAVANGGSVSSQNSFLGTVSGGNGAATVTGAGSAWNSSGFLDIGGNPGGVGNLAIQAGGQVASSVGYLGSYGGSGTATISGTGSTWSNSDSLYVGGNEFYDPGGTGALTVATGGTLVVNNLLKIWGSGNVHLNGGTISTGILEPAAGTFNFTAGTLNLTSSDLLVDTGGVLGPAISLPSIKALGVSGTTTLGGAGTLALDGGTFSTGSLVDNGGFTFNRGTFNLTSDDLIIGTGGLFGPLVQFDYGQTVNVTNNTTVDSGAVLSLNNGAFSAGTLNNSGQVTLGGAVAALGGRTLNNAGLVSGNGQIGAVLQNGGGGEVRATAGGSLLFTGAGNTNGGRITLQDGNVQFTQDLTNAAGGLITGRGTLYATGGLTNAGNIGLSGGTTDLHGDVNNATGGSIIVSGNATATFFDDVVHNGTEIRVSNGSSAVFFGSVSGAGSYTGTGTVFFEGDLTPGNSPGLVSVEGDLSLGFSARTIMEVAGLGRGTAYDAFDIGGELFLGGALDVVLYDAGGGPFAPSLGDSFDLFLADSITGDFDRLMLAALGGGLGWQLDILADAIGVKDVVRLSVVASAVPVPPALWLFGSGLLGLAGVARRRAA